jgi:type IV pilus assembly protein PilQ
MVVKTRAEAEHSIKAERGSLEVRFTPVQVDWAIAAVEPMEAEAETATADADTWSQAIPSEELSPEVEDPFLEDSPTEIVDTVAARAKTPAEADQGIYEPAAGGVAATQLQSIEINSDHEETVVTVLGDGEFFYSTFSLEDPDRYVLDVIGVVNNAPLSAVPVGNELVNQVRVAQFKTEPELVSRVVVDLARQTVPQVTRRHDGLALVFAPNASTTFVEDMTASMTPPAAERTTEIAAEIPTEPIAVSADQQFAQYPAESEYETRQADLDTITEAEGMGAVDIGTAPTAGLPALSPAESTEYGVAPAAAPSDVDLYGQSAADAESDPSAVTDSLFDSQEATSNERRYLGEPMTITVKDADIKDILRSFAEISGLNVVVQPGVSGRVTVELKDVPWDQALEQILKINSLGYQLEGNIMRVAPVSQLRQEAEEQQRLRQAEALAVPLRTVIRRVSYASASEVASLLKSGGAASVMSRRGTVIVDQRTNTLIIKEIPGFMDVVIAVIETLDTPEPQVLIEARIVETTKRYNNSLGINWGFDGIADAPHGNTTGLQFPNNISTTGRVNLATGGANGLLGVSLGNVLNSFTLDAVLTAAESEGLINVLSAPRVTTLNNQPATIQSGLQIPIQTVANNTVSVQFVNATLRLNVTPHVTAEGTVLMSVDIQKREPQLAFAVVGATNAPIATQEARTRVIVRDGGTTVIGGIYKISSDRGEDRVPGLSNIPILKHLFKNKRRNDENEELLIFITPRVVKL